MRYILSVCGALAIAACDVAPDSATTHEGDMASAMPTEETAPYGADASTTAGAPQQFVDTVAASDMYEIAAAKLAQKSSASQAIKDFAAMMIKDHTSSSTELEAAAQKVKPPITVTPALSPDQQAMLDALEGAGANFDAMYAEQQVDAHNKALDILRTYARSGGDASLKLFAVQTAAVVEGHASHARKLLAK